MGRKKKAKDPGPPGGAASEPTVEQVVEAVFAVAEEPRPEPVFTSPLVVTEKGTVSTSMAPRAVSVFYSPALAEEIHELFLGGMSLHKIAQIDGMPSYGALLRWYKENRDFREMIDAARTTRALHHEEEALRAADGATEKDEVPAARLKFDAHVWAAEVNDPTRYGKKTTVQGNPDKPIIFQISTGVPEREDTKTITLNADGTVQEVVGTDQKVDNG